MSTQRKVAVITGASQRIGAGRVRGLVDLGYRAVANSRSIQPYASAEVPAAAGDIADPEVTTKQEHLAKLFPRDVTHVRDSNSFGAGPGSSRR